MMAVTGLAWCGFVVTHMAGNLLMFAGADAYNSYSHKLTSNPLIYVAEAGLVVTLLAHMFFAIRVSLENRRARPVGYAVGPHGEKGGVNFASKTLAYSGMLIFAFVVWHLITFKYGPVYPVFYQGDVIRDLHRLVLEVFQSTLYFGGYLFMMVVLAAHLSHALWSSLQTLGLVKAGRETCMHQASIAFGLIVGGGFALTPLYVYFTMRN